MCLQHKDEAKLNAMGGVEGLAEALKVSTDEGLDASATGDLSLERRQELYGANRFASVPAKSFWAILWDALSDKVLIVLMVAATVCSFQSLLCLLFTHVHGCASCLMSCCSQTSDWCHNALSRHVTLHVLLTCVIRALLQI